MAFHVCFARTQATAKKMAERFNEQVRRRLSAIDPSNSQRARVFEIHFLPCSVYTFMENGVERSVLVEEYLPHFRYMKWNGNNGYVRGRGGRDSAGFRSGPPVTDMAPDRRPPPRGHHPMGAILEEEEREDDDERDDRAGSDSDGSIASLGECEPIDYGLQQAVLDNISELHHGGGPGGRRRWNPYAHLVFDPKAEDFLQAFSHFSYTSSARRMLVCDLQGVMTRTPSRDGDIVAGKFQLTDPVIHYRSSSGRKQVYGKTDLGKKGAHRFFETHDCNDVCRLLGLPQSVSGLAPQDGGGGGGFAKRRRIDPRPPPMFGDQPFPWYQ